MPGQRELAQGALRLLKTWKQFWPTDRPPTIGAVKELMKSQIRPGSSNPKWTGSEHVLWKMTPERQKLVEEDPFTFLGDTEKEALAILAPGKFDLDSLFDSGEHQRVYQAANRYLKHLQKNPGTVANRELSRISGDSWGLESDFEYGSSKAAAYRLNQQRYNDPRFKEQDRMEDAKARGLFEGALGKLRK